MYATRTGNTINVSTDMIKAFKGITEGYSVTLHALPKIVFHVDAETTDNAQALAYAVAKKEKAPMLRDSNAATIVKLG